MSDQKPNCYECIHRGTIPGDAHSRCCHPSVKQDDNPFGALVEMLTGNSMKAAKELGIKGNDRGIKGGWFMWPANFDPVWLTSCNGFKEKTEEKNGTLKTKVED